MRNHHISHSMPTSSSNSLTRRHSPRNNNACTHASQKDSMRKDCVPTLVEVFYSVIATYRKPYPPLANMCLATMRPYIGARSPSFHSTQAAVAC